MKNIKQIPKCTRIIKKIYFKPVSNWQQFHLSCDSFNKAWFRVNFLMWQKVDVQNFMIVIVHFYSEKKRTMADNKFRPACHWLDIKMWSWHYVQLTPFTIFVILVIVTAIIKIKIGKRSVHLREVLLQISYAGASWWIPWSWSVSYEKGEGNAKQLENLQFDKLTHQS
jgi:hypothetical protein